MKTDWFYLYIIVLLALAFWLGFQIGLASIEYHQFCVNYIPNRQNSQNTALFAPVSAYTLSEDETDSRPCETASGLNLCSLDLVENRFVACPRHYPFGTKFEIAGEVWECQDRMNKRYANKFDLLLPTKEMAINWGVREVSINIINH